MNINCGNPIWDPDFGPQFWTPPFWTLNWTSIWDTLIWDPDLGPQFGTPIFDPDLDLDLGHPHLGP
jgi:hypothetical protein